MTRSGTMLATIADGIAGADDNFFSGKLKRGTKRGRRLFAGRVFVCRNAANRHPPVVQFTNQFLNSDMNPTLRPKRRYRRPQIEAPQVDFAPVLAPVTGNGSAGYRLKRSGHWQMVPRAPRRPVPTTREQFAAAMTNAVNNAFERMQHFLPLRHSH